MVMELLWVILAVPGLAAILAAAVRVEVLLLGGPNPRRIQESDAGFHARAAADGTPSKAQEPGCTGSVLGPASDQVSISATAPSTPAPGPGYPVRK
jgi:hypothetical protein